MTKTFVYKNVLTMQHVIKEGLQDLYTKADNRYCGKKDQKTKTNQNIMTFVQMFTQLNLDTTTKTTNKAVRNITI